jgi:hypothetical protein
LFFETVFVAFDDAALFHWIKLLNTKYGSIVLGLTLTRQDEMQQLPIPRIGHDLEHALPQLVDSRRGVILLPSIPIATVKFDRCGPEVLLDSLLSLLSAPLFLQGVEQIAVSRHP